MKRFTILFSFALLFVCATTVFAQTIGNSTQGTTTYPSTTTAIASEAAANGHGAGMIVASLFTMGAASGTVTSLGIDISTALIAGDHTVIGIYSDNSSAPGSLLGQTAEMTGLTGTGWKTATLTTPVHLTANTKYWIGFNGDWSNKVYYTSSGPANSAYYQTPGYSSTLPNPWPSSGNTVAGTPVNLEYIFVQIEGYIKGYKYQYTGTTGYFATNFNFYVHSSASSHFNLALYNDAGGSPSKPNQLLWYSGSTAATAGQNNRINEWSGTTANSWDGTFTNGNWYWLMWQWDNTSTGPSYTAGVANTGIYLAQTYGSFPNSWSGVGTNTSEQWTEYASYASVLPVELYTFTAKLNGKEVELEWSTATEVNNYGFEIERAIVNGELRIANWEKIGFVQGHGNSNSPKEYSFADNNSQPGKIQYRLKQIDFDGRFEYSWVVEVEVSAPSSFALEQNYPNPFNPVTKINYEVPANSFVQLKVYNMLGMEVATLVNEEKIAGTYEVKFDASNYSSGVYFYRLKSTGKDLTRKMILLK